MSKDPGIQVPAGLHLQSRLFAATAGLWRRLGNIETSVLKEELAGVEISRPVYVTSLARAGTTIVTEMMEQHPQLTSHRYSDFPNIWTPYWRNDLLQKSRRETPRLEERAHRDGIQVSQDSPEAVEEVLWSHFFPGLHEEGTNQVLDDDRRNPGFDDFYRDHIRKLLAVRDSSRYLAKGNYNIARLRYLLSLFPDAHFLVPLRDPVNHIASLAKQHRLFQEASQQDPRVGRQLSLSGHFEFGPHRTFINFGDAETARQIRACWDQGREAEGWALYWAATYRHLDRQLRNNPDLAHAVFLFRYEDLCTHSDQLIDAMLGHCGLEPTEFAGARAEYSQRLSLPDYYQPEFSTADAELIRSHCDPVLASIQEHLSRPV